MNPRRFLAAAFCAAALSSLLWAGDVSFTAEADKTAVSMDDAVTLRVTLSGQGLENAKPAVPEAPGFRISPAGQSQNISFVNGRVSSESTRIYVLQPQSPGKHRIPPFTVQVDGQTYATAPIDVEVAAGGSAPAAGAPAPGGAGAEESGGRDLFLKASLDKASAYVGEPVTLTVRFYSRVQLLSQPAYAPPDATGFLTEDLPPQRNTVEALRAPDGSVRRYSVVELKTALFPAAPGTLTVGPAALECRAEDSSGNDPFGGGFFGGIFSSGRPVTLRSAPLKLKVLPLPAEGRPAGFRGDVGRYRLAAALDRDAAALREPVTLSVTVSGEGNLNALSQPALPPLAGFKAYETLSGLNLSKEGWKVSGSKTFKTILKPVVSGRVEIPAVSFSYFDPEARAYRTATAGPLALSVSGAAAAEEDAAEPAPALSAEGLKVISQDVRYVKDGRLRRKRKPLGSAPWFPPLNALPGACFLLLAASRALRRRAEADPAARAARRAGKEAARSAGAAAAFLAEGKTVDAWERLERALREYLAARLALSPQGLTWDETAAALSDRGAGGDALERLRGLWEGLQGARYSPAAADPSAAARALEDFKKLVPALEALWKR